MNFLLFWRIFYNTIIPLAHVGYEMVIANEASSTISCAGDVSRGIIITQMHIMQTVGISLGFLIGSLTASETYNTASFIYLQRNLAFIARAESNLCQH